MACADMAIFVTIVMQSFSLLCCLWCVKCAFNVCMCQDLAHRCADVMMNERYDSLCHHLADVYDVYWA